MGYYQRSKPVSRAGQAWLDMPTVYQSNSTGECVKVVTKQGDGSCDTLPSRYVLIITE